MVWIWLLLGLILLVAGGDGLVRGASGLAQAFGISPLIIGLTVVAFGTSSPELAVSLMSAYSGQADLALGNVVGSNIFNVLLILGISAAIIPLMVVQQLIRLDVPILIGLSFLLFFLGLDGLIGRGDGLLLTVLGIAYTVLLIVISRRQKQTEMILPSDADTGAHKERHWLNGLYIIGGLVLLVLGSRWLVDSAVAIARAWEVSELVIGLTIVAAGTSLPEVAASIIASVRRERDIAVGNVVGSCIFNIVFVLGLSGLLAPNGIPVADGAIHFDLPIMIATAVACLPIFFSGQRISRWEGFLFLGYYVAYTLYILLSLQQHEFLSTFRQVMIFFVIPLTVVTLLVIAVKPLARNNK